MAWILKEKELAALLAADGQRRYDYFIHRVCDTKKVWGLYQEGWASMADEKQNLMPLWPHEKFAELFRPAEWSTHESRFIDLDDFLKIWIPSLRAERIEPAIFPTPNGSAVVVSLDHLEQSLWEELREVHGYQD